MKMILGEKIGMTHLFSKDGKFIPVTKVKTGDNFVVQVKTEEKDGYNALQIGFGETKKIKKPQEGHLKKAKLPKLKYLREVRIEKEDIPKHKPGEKININIFKEGELVDITGISKGKGFQGVIKRHGFHRGPMSHGSDHHREPGSIGSMFPQRVFKGKKLPGRMGGEKVTIKNLVISKIDSENQIIFIKGAIPGPNKSLVLIKGEGVMYHEPEKHEITQEKENQGKKEEKTEKTEKQKEEVENKESKNEIKSQDNKEKENAS